MVLIISFELLLITRIFIVQLFLGTRDITDSSRKIYESDGNFQSGTDHTFFASFPSTFSPPPSDDYMYLTLVLKMDLYVRLRSATWYTRRLIYTTITHNVRPGFVVCQIPG